MQQLEFKFFWPLTEQIPLSLDYAECDTRLKITNTGTLLSIGNSGSWVTTAQHVDVMSVNTKGVTIDSGTITIKGMQMPWYRKLLFKLIGFHWND